jgi:hypothetical protein
MHRGGLSGWDLGCLTVILISGALAFLGFIIVAAGLMFAGFAYTLYLGVRRGHFGVLLGVDGTRENRPAAFWITAAIFALLTAGSFVRLLQAILWLG